MSYHAGPPASSRHRAAAPACSIAHAANDHCRTAPATQNLAADRRSRDDNLRAGWPGRAGSFQPRVLREHTAAYDSAREGDTSAARSDGRTRDGVRGPDASDDDLRATARVHPEPDAPLEPDAPPEPDRPPNVEPDPHREPRAHPEPDRPPHPVDDAAWRYVHDLDEPRPGEGTPPFGLPVLAEIPGLATVLEQLREADRFIARALEGILLLQDHADVAATTGVGIDAWVTTIARRTRADARMLLAAAEMVRRLPTLRTAFQQGQLSWAQVRSVALKARSLPTHLDARVDSAIAAALDGVGGAEPDAITRVISWSLAALQPQEVERRERREQEREFLSLQPRLDGSGGRLWGELGPTSWAVVDAALGNITGQGQTTLTAAPGTGAGLGPVRGTEDESMTGPRTPGEAGGPGSAARARAHRLVELLDASLTGAAGPAATRTLDPSDDRTRGSGRDATGPDVTTGTATGASRPQLILRADLDSLLDRERTPGTLLTSLLGGHVHVSSRTARRLLDERGADLRTVILDDTGGVVGVGRRQRVAPGWLRDAVLALHDTCAAPGCVEPARSAEIDHARPWHPVHPDDLPGETDIDQLAPACPRHNLRKERDGWQVQQSSDGRRRWIHQRSGLRTDTLPAVWRASGAPPGPAPPDDPAA